MPRIVHLGPGAFARAFVFPFLQDAFAASPDGWTLDAISLRSADTRDALRAQDWNYIALALSDDGETPRRVTVLNDLLVAPEDPAGARDRLADPATAIVTLTITEKGYCHDPATGRLNPDHPDIRHDLGHPWPRSAPGTLVRALQRRRARGLPPFTTLSCDNLPSNGALTRRVVTDLARRLDPGLADWINATARFPSSMVDRITPATTDADRARVTRLTGWRDAAPVVHEPFAQWVVEDDFTGPRPDLPAAGVDLVADVAPHEAMKLRMLNGTHSALAYTGYLAGHETIADTVADPVFAAYARSLWSEIAPGLTAPPMDPDSYAKTLLARYRNGAIRHRTWQIAMDGSQKLPQRLLAPLRDNLKAGRDSPALILAVAAWCRYAGGTDLHGAPIDLRDPLADALRDRIGGAPTSDTAVDAALSFREIFDADIARQIHAPLRVAARRLWTDGARAALRAATS